MMQTIWIDFPAGGQHIGRHNRLPSTGRDKIFATCRVGELFSFSAESGANSLLKSR
jgi:hypothetical protein